MTLKKKSIEVLEYALANPQASQVEAYHHNHRTENRRSAISNAYKLFRKPEAKIYLQKHVNIARKRIVELSEKGKEDVALRASQDILDREYGKPTQKQEARSTRLNISLGVSENKD